MALDGNVLHDLHWDFYLKFEDTDVALSFWHLGIFARGATFFKSGHVTTDFWKCARAQLFFYFRRISQASTNKVVEVSAENRQ